ncbi:hypothetical protein Dimus_015921 [Dionaea muscipula]
MTRIHLKKKDVVKSSVKGISIEFDHEQSVAILDVPRRTGICEYIKEVWEESRYTKPLEITVRFANDATIMKARRVQSVEMKPSQRFIHFLVMKNVIPRFGKRDTSSFLDLTYMDHIMARRLAHFGFQAFGVPLVIKKGEEPKKYDFFEDTFLTMCKLTREDGIWWIGSGENRRRDDDEATPEEEAEGDDEGNKDDFDREAIIDEATAEGESGRRADDVITDEDSAVPASSSTQEKIKNSQESTLGSYSRDARISEVPANLNEKEPTDFMMNRRRPKPRMPNF